LQLRPFTIVFLLAALGGFFFSAYATADFIQHLDRQVHGLHCSFIPGASTPDISGTSGCHVTLMSSWSSVFRQSVWGGIPISMASMSVFAYLLYRGLDLLLNKREKEPGTTLYLVAASLLPVLASLVMGYISMVELDAFCKLCIGTYISSFGVFIGALGIWRGALSVDPDVDPSLSGGEGELSESSDQTLSGHIGSFALGVVFVVLPMLMYTGLMPDYEKYIGACGELPKPEDSYKIMVPLDTNKSGLEAIELFDPLCPSCKGFEERLSSSGLSSELHRKAVLFPLDNSCNWMVGTSMHPGACAVSEAVLCASGENGDVAKVNKVIAWAFEHQEEIRTAAKDKPESAAEAVVAAFPELKSCVGSPKIRQKLNQSFRWAVNNQVPVLTPQVYVNNQKLCDEDTDLGMDFALSRLIAKTKGATP
jgi:uncharacterized membrane protein